MMSLQSRYACSISSRHALKVLLIPPSSNKQFLNIVREANDDYKSEQLEELMKKIAEAIKEDKWLIHFGA